MKATSPFPLFGIVFFLVVVFSAQGVLGDGAKPRLSDKEAIKKLSKEPQTIQCYTCSGCSDASKLTPGTKKDCIGAAYRRTDPVDGDHELEPAFYKPHCSITFGPHGVVARGCLPDFLDQHTHLSSGIGDPSVGGKCSEMKHEKGAFNGFTCWCAGKLCNFGTVLRPRIDVMVGMVAAVLGVAAFNIL